MSGENDRRGFSGTLKESIDLFKARFTTDYDCYNFLYQRLLGLGRLNENQCTCPGYKIVRESRENEVLPKSKKFVPQFFSGATGKTFIPVFRRYKISHPLPDKLPYNRNVKVFAECSFCNHKYFVAESTVFHGQSSPIKSLLILFLIAEFYGFDKSCEMEIMKGFRAANVSADNLIGSSTNIKKHKEYLYNEKTLYRYRKKLLDPINYTELSSYAIIEQLWIEK